MNGWFQQQCSLCKGKGQLDIGRNEDKKSESIERCPLCNNKGWLEIYKHYWGKPHRRLLW